LKGAFAVALTSAIQGNLVQLPNELDAVGETVALVVVEPALQRRRVAAEARPVRLVQPAALVVALLPDERSPVKAPVWSSRLSAQRGCEK